MNKLSKYIFTFLLGSFFAAGTAFAWNAMWHDVSWIKTGEPIRSKELGEMLQYLYERSIPLNMEACNGADQALKWDGNTIYCDTVTVSNVTNVSECTDGETTESSCFDTATGDTCRTQRVCTYNECVNGAWVPRTTTSTVTDWWCVSNQTCFTADALVTMADGSKKAIAHVRIGDKVKNSEGGVNTVLAYDRPKLGERYLYAFNDSEDYFVTAEHPFLTTDGWKAIDPKATEKEKPSLAYSLKVSQLKVGDIIITENGTFKVTKIKKKKSDPTQTLYNLILDGDHTYIVNGFVVHNKD